MIYIIIILVVIAAYELLIIFCEKKHFKKYDKEDKTANVKPEIEDIAINNDLIPYQKKLLLTKNEYYFYKKLKKVADENNLQIISKVRLADIVEVNNEVSPKEKSAYFNKIRSKHIDFAIVDEMKLVLLIELDDNSHQKETRKQRDEFVDKVLQKCGYKIIHTFGDTESIETTLKEYKSPNNT